MEEQSRKSVKGLPHDSCNLWDISFIAANIAIKQNSIDYAELYPLAAEVVQKGFYVDDCLTGADSIELQQQIHNFSHKASSSFANGVLMTLHLFVWFLQNYVRNKRATTLLMLIDTP